MPRGRQDGSAREVTRLVIIDISENQEGAGRHSDTSLHKPLSVILSAIYKVGNPSVWICDSPSLLPAVSPKKVREREQEESSFFWAIMSAQRDPVDLNKQ